MPKLEPKVIGLRLAATRKALGYAGDGRVAAFLDQLDGYDKGSYSKTEKGERMLSLDLALRIYDRFGVSLDWLYCGAKAAIDEDLYREIRKVS